MSVLNFPAWFAERFGQIAIISTAIYAIWDGRKRILDVNNYSKARDTWDKKAIDFSYAAYLAIIFIYALLKLQHSVFAPTGFLIFIIVLPFVTFIAGTCLFKGDLNYDGQPTRTNNSATVNPQVASKPTNNETATDTPREGYEEQRQSDNAGQGAATKGLSSGHGRTAEEKDRRMGKGEKASIRLRLGWDFLGVLFVALVAPFAGAHEFIELFSPEPKCEIHTSVQNPPVGTQERHLQGTPGTRGKFG